MSKSLLVREGVYSSNSYTGGIPDKTKYKTQALAKINNNAQPKKERINIFDFKIFITFIIAIMKDKIKMLK